MNASARTISVNPALPTEADKACVSRIARITIPRRSPSTNLYEPYDAVEESTRSLRAAMSLFFGISGKRDGMSAPLDSITLLARVLFGTFLIFCGAIGGAQSVGSVLSLTLGITLALGIFTRLSMLGYGILQAYEAVILFQDGVISPVCISLCAIALFIALIGPGHISFDSLVGYRITSSVIASRERKLRARRFSYRAYALNHL